MKVLFEFKKSILISFVIFIILAVMIMGRSYTEEKSSLGTTYTENNITKSYLNNVQLSIATPKTYTRYYLDTKTNWAAKEMNRVNMQLLALSENQDIAVEIYVLNLENDGEGGQFVPYNVELKDYPKNVYSVKMNIAEFDSDELEEFVQYSVLRMENQNEKDYLLSTEVNYEVVNLGDNTFVKGEYEREDTLHTEFDAVVEYFTYMNGYVIEVRTYSIDSSRANIASYFTAINKNMDE